MKTPAPETSIKPWVALVAMAAEAEYFTSDAWRKTYAWVRRPTIISKRPDTVVSIPIPAIIPIRTPCLDRKLKNLPMDSSRPAITPTSGARDSPKFVNPTFNLAIATANLWAPVF